MNNAYKFNHKIIQSDEFELTEFIAEGNFSYVYKGFLKKDNTPVVVKVSKDENLSEEAVKVFKREAQSLASLDHPNIIKIYHFGNSFGRMYLVLEYFNGMSVRTIMERQNSSVDSLMNWLKQIITGLNVIHGRAIVHRDLKPENILIDSEGNLKIIDLGLVEEMGSNVSNRVVGSLLYAAPEQLGATKRPVDYRADQYSLGAFLFEFFAGHRPLEAADYNELINWHTANEYPNFKEKLKSAPEKLRLAIEVLLQKDPDNRFNSIAGLYNYLYSNAEEIKSDVFIGRDKEWSILCQYWDEFSDKKNQTLLVQGQPGVGKSYLVKQFVEKFIYHECIFISTKCEQDKDIPLQTLNQLNRQMANYLLQPELEGILKELKKQLTTQQLCDFCDVFPQYYKVFSTEFTLEIEPSGNANSFQILNQIFEIISSNYSVIVHIDDIQWMDSESLNFFENFNQDLSRITVFQIFTARNDTESLKAVDIFRQKIKCPEEKCISLENFNEAQSKECINLWLGKKEVDHKIQETVVNRSDGNPFAISEFIKVFVNEEYIKFNWGAWQVESKNFSDVNLPQSIIHLITKRLAKLPGEVIDYLSIAAVSGAIFKCRDIADCLGVSEEIHNRILNDAIEQRIIEKVDPERMCFVHDRIVESLRNSMPIEAKSQIHWLLAHKILGLKNYENLKYEQLKLLPSQELFTLADHLLNCENQVPSRLLFEVLVTAGESALNSHLNEDAGVFLQKALKFTSEFGYVPRINIWALMAEVYYRAHNLDQANDFILSAIEREKIPIKRASHRITLVKIILSQIDMGNTELLKQSKKALYELGDWSHKNFVFLVLATIKDLFFSLTRLSSLLSRDRKKQILLSRAHFMRAHIGYHQIEIPTSFLHTLRAYFSAARVGPTQDLSIACFEVAVGMAFMKLHPLTNYFKRKGFEIASGYADRGLDAECEMYSAIADEMSGKPIRFERAARKVLFEKKDYLHTINYLNGSFALLWNYGLGGHIEKMYHMYHNIISHLKMVRGKHVGTDLILETHAGPVNTLYGDFNSKITIDIENIDQGSYLIKRNKYLAALVLQNVILLSIAQDKLNEETVDKIKADFDELSGMNPFYTAEIPPGNFYIFLPIAYAKLCENNFSKTVFLKFKKATRTLWFSGMSPYHRGHYLYLKGYQFFLNGKVEKALTTLNKATLFARKFNFPWVELEAAYYRALVYQHLKNSSAMADEVRSALGLAQQSGFKARSKQILAKFKDTVSFDLTSNSSAGSSRLNSSYAKSSTHLMRDRQFESLKSLSLDLSPVLDIEKQKMVALKTILKTLGAERVFLFAGEGGESEIFKFQMGIDRNGELQGESDVSYTLISSVLKNRRPIVYTGESDNLISASKSIIAKDIRSIIAAPLILGEKMLGLIYCDNRLIRGVFSHEEKDLLQAMSNHIAFSLEMARAAQIEIAKIELEQNMELTGFVQSMLIPKESKFENENLTCVFHYEPAELAGGDWIFSLPEKDNFMFFLGDVTGHGVGAAMITSLMAGSFETSIRNEISQENRVERVFKNMHDNLIKFCRGEYAMSSSCFQIDYNTKELVAYFAGAPEIFLVRKGKFMVLSELGSILGTSEFSLGKVKKKLLSEDRIIVFTDGLYEMKSSEDVGYGLARFRRFLSKKLDFSTEELVGEIDTELKRWRKEKALDDDLSFAIIDIK